MFVSPKAAAERLSDERNLFRDSSASQGNGSHTSPDALGVDRLSVVIPETQPDPEPEIENTVDVPTEALESDQEILPVETSPFTLSKLDELINPLPRTRLRNNIDAQVAVGETSVILGPSAASRMLGLSIEQVGAYERGLSSNAQRIENPPVYANDAARKKKLEDRKALITEKAAERIINSLDILTADRLGRVGKATDVARIAKDMAVIMEKATPKEAAEGGIHFHLYRPEIKQENHYETIEIGSKV